MFFFIVYTGVVLHNKTNLISFDINICLHLTFRIHLFLIVLHPSGRLPSLRHGWPHVLSSFIAFVYFLLARDNRASYTDFRLSFCIILHDNHKSIPFDLESTNDKRFHICLQVVEDWANLYSDNPSSRVNKSMLQLF